MFSFSDSSKERDMEVTTSVEAATHTQSDGSFTLASGSSGQGLFTSLLKGEPSAKTPGATVFLAPHNTDNKEKSIFGKPSFFSFTSAATSSAPEVTPFQVKNISIGLSTPPPSTTVVTMSSSQSLSLANPQISLKSIPGDFTMRPFASSSVFALPKESTAAPVHAPKIPVVKTETSFSFAETFRKETMDKSSFAEPQPEQQGIGIFGKPPTFSFSSAAANILSDNKVSDQSSSIGMTFRGTPCSVPLVPSRAKDHDHQSSKGEHEDTNETLTRKSDGIASPITASNKTSSSLTTSRASAPAIVSKTVPRITLSRVLSETTSSKSSNGTTNKASSGNSGDKPIKLHRDSPGSSSAFRHTVKDHGSSVVRKIKQRKELSTTKIRKKSKEDEGKADSKSSGLLTLEEIQKLTSIVCKGIHPDLNHRSDLIKHFSKFGQIRKVSCSIRHNHAVITFVTHEAAKKAKKLGSIISPNFNPVEIFWHTQSSKSSDDQKPLFQSEVHEELESMMEFEAHDILHRPAKHQSRKSPPKISTSHRKQIEKSDLKDSKHSEKIKSTKSSSSNEESLTKLLEMPALTEDDKYQVLNARDKLMRLSFQKQSDISKAKAVVGTCPDICSEKERYSRFEKTRLSIYEQKKTFDPSITVKCLDHRIIVKEYSRSSADKEDPLPHELRPTHVLSLAMDHLMCNIANRGTDSSLSVGEWYDFIWNRTRAIRKDIVQQDLCSIECLKLVEKCVRFHIHCAAALCEEDLAVFDPKINDENLTKSLQTLKHMYHDLALNGIRCPNEAEFRAYDILLSLNEGDTLRQAQNFSSKIRISSEVRFAVSAAFAMNSNNYSRFFKLVEEASYLNACIMHRYFTPVRVRALRVMLKAYCLPNHVESYPLEELVKILKFESVTEASQFCQWLGFKTDENHVQLDRMSFVKPTSSTFVTRSINLVEKKRTVSLGEVMNKGPLPVNPLVSYEPHCSFDCDGYLKKEAYDASDQKLKTERGNTTVTITVIRPELVSEENKLVPPNEPVVTMRETSVDSSLKRESATDHSMHDASVDSSLKRESATDHSMHDTFVDSSLKRESATDHSMHDTSVDSSLKRESTTDHYLAAGASQLCSSPISKTAEIEKPSDSKNLSICVTLPTANEQKNVCNQEQVVQSVQKVGQEKVHSSPGLRSADIMKYTSDMWKQLSSEVIESLVREIATREHKTEVVCTSLRDSLIGKVVKNLCFEVSCDVIRDVTREELAACELEKQKEECASSLAEEMILETVQEHSFNFVEHEYQEAKAQILDAVCTSLVATIVDSCVTNLVTSVAKEVHSQETNAWQNLVRVAKRKTQLQQAKKAITKWRRAYMKRRKLEICRDTFPCSPQIPLKLNSSLSGHECVLSKVKKKEKLSKLLDAGVLLSSIKQEFSWLPLDLAGLFEKHFPQLEIADSAIPKKICWKLLLLIPEDCGDDNDTSWTSFIHWFCAKFCREKYKNTFENGTILCDLFEKRCDGYHADICVRAVLLGSKDFHQNLEVMKKKKLLEGTSAVFLLIPYYRMNDLVHKEIFSQVRQIFRVKRPFPSVPLYCFLVGSKFFQIQSTVTQVFSSMKKEKLLCDYKVSSVEDATQYWKSSEELSEATAWLLQRYEEVPALISCSLKDFVENCFLKIFSIIFEDLSHVTSPTKAQNPSKMVIFYNSVIHDYTEAVCSSGLSKISWPPPEVIQYAHVSEGALGWNDLENLNKIRTTLAKIRLPEFHGSPVSLDDLWTYVREIASIGGSDSCTFFSSIKSFIMNNEQFVADSISIPWSDVVYDCAHYLMSCQSFVDESTKKELEIMYVSEDLNHIDLKLKWKNIPQKNEVVITDESVSVKKRKYFPERVHASLQPGDAYLSDILEQSPAKYARNEKKDEDQGLTFEQLCKEKRMQPSQSTYHGGGNLSMSNLMCDTERKSFFLIEALAAEKCQSESYLAHLEAKVAEGQCASEGILDDSSLEQDYDDEIEASSSQPYDRKPGYNQKEEFSVPSTSVNLNKSLEEFKSRLTTQQKANESYERRLKEFM